MKYTENYRVRLTETDARGRIKPSAIIDIMQENAMGAIAEIKHSNREMHEKDGKAFIISRMTVELDGVIQEGDNIEAITWAAHGKAASYPRCYEFKLGDKSVVRGIGMWAMVDIASKKLVLHNEYYEDSSFEEDAITLGVPDRFRIPSELEMNESNRLRVTYSMTDCNGHMNNVKYVDPMWDAIPNIATRTLKSFSIRYAHEARLGDELIVTWASEPGEDGIDTYYVRLSTEEGMKAESKWVVE